MAHRNRNQQQPTTSSMNEPGRLYTAKPQYMTPEQQQQAAQQQYKHYEQQQRYNQATYNQQQMVYHQEPGQYNGQQTSPGAAGPAGGHPWRQGGEHQQQQPQSPQYMSQSQVQLQPQKHQLRQQPPQQQNYSETITMAPGGGGGSHGGPSTAQQPGHAPWRQGQGQQQQGYTHTSMSARPGASGDNLPPVPKQFTDDQIRRYRRIFDMFDINKDGVLEARELAAVSQIMGYRMERNHVMNILKNLDLDTNGVLTFEEFLQAMPGNVKYISEEQHRSAELRMKFQEYDRDCNGVITKDEAHIVLQRELGFTPEQTRTFVNKFDINADGMLSYEEFVLFYLKVKERKEAIDKAFMQFDQDGKGYVSLADAKRILGGLLFSEAEVEALVDAHDTNRDGKLQYDEFMHFWTV